MAKSNLKAIFYDNVGSSYLPQAIKLAQYFDKMYYYTSYNSPFPLIAPTKPGTGYNQIQVITNFWETLQDADIVIFGDIYCKDVASEVRKAGKLTFGGGQSEDIETNRGLFYSMLERLGMNNGEYTTIQGITKLKTYLKSKKNKYIKISYFRGQIETFKWVSQNYNQQLLDELEFELGPLGDSIEFICQSMIIAETETGFDGYAVNGQLPTKFCTSIEIKDAGCLSKADSKNTCPIPVNEVNEQFQPALQAYGHTGFYSTEVRYNPDTKQSYFIDPCLRLGNPPSNIYISLISNWDSILVEGAKGNLVEPTFRAKYGVEIILKSQYTADNFMPVFFPPEFKDNINFKGSFILNDITYVIPFKKTCGYNLEEIGSVVVIGNDYNQIMKEALDIASKIQAYDLSYSETALEKALEQMKTLEDNLDFKF